MHAPRFVALFAGGLLSLALASQPRAESKYFQASQRHFEDLASKAVSLVKDMDAPEEKNACNFFTATAMTYAVRAHALAQLTDVAAQVQLPEDKALLRLKLAETQAYSSRFIDGDLKTMEGLAASSKNSRIKQLGLRLVNELRVFEHNISAIATP